MSTLISVDLDDVGCYHAIHGLPPPPPESLGIVLERCLPRFLDLFAEIGATATFFLIGRDLERDHAEGGRGAELLRRALEAGHELGNHSHAHAYDLSRWPADRISQDLMRCDRMLRDLGAAPLGFRAPGYTHDRRLLLQVAGAGYRYDSSALPSPPYYLAKLGVLVWMRLQGRKSAAIREGISGFLGGSAPRYLPGLGLWEVPISVSPLLRLPLIGTSLLAGPAALADALRADAARLPHLHVELHGLDLADEAADGFSPALRDRQPELRTPLAVRKSRLHELLATRGGGSSIIRALGR